MTIHDQFTAAWASREWGLWGIDDEACARYWFEKGYREAMPTPDEVCAMGASASLLEFNGQHVIAAFIREYLKRVEHIQSLAGKEGG